MKLRGVLFDATGTLIELREPVGEIYSRALRAFGGEISAWRLGDAFRRIHRQAPPMLFPGESSERVAELERDWWYDVVRATLRAADSSLQLTDFGAFFETLYAAFATATCWRVRPGCIQALRELRALGLATGVVSNFDHRLEDILEALEITDLLDVVVLPCGSGAAKPDPLIFTRALADLELPAADVAFVGDDAERDLAGARRVGMRAVNVTTLATLADLPQRLCAMQRPAPRECHEGDA